jgi:glucose-6-phosphate isomerase
LINVNAYHQPGVEAGKKAAGGVLSLQGKVLNHLKVSAGKSFSAEEICVAIGSPEDAETVYKICKHLSANSDRGVTQISGTTGVAARFQMG